MSGKLAEPVCDCCRYLDLVQKINQFYADEAITSDELKQMTKMREETRMNYQVSVEMLHHLKPSAKDYEKLSNLVDYFRRCYQVMEHATQKGVLYNQFRDEIPKNQGISSGARKKLAIRAEKEAAVLIGQLATAKKRRLTEEAQMIKEAQDISPDVKEHAIRNITHTLNVLEQEQLFNARQQIIAIQKMRC